MWPRGAGESGADWDCSADTYTLPSVKQLGRGLPDGGDTGTPVTNAYRWMAEAGRNVVR